MQIMKIRSAFLLAALCAGGVCTPGEASDLTRGGVVLMIGDSILDIQEGEHRVEAVMLRLAKEKTPQANWVIHNEAHGGQYIGPKIGEPGAVTTPLFTTESTGQIFDTLARYPKVDAVIVNYAANDAKVYPPAHFRQRLEALGALLEKTYPGARLIFSTSMYLDPAHSLPFTPGKSSFVPSFRDGGTRSDYLEAYNGQIRQFTAAHGYVLADLCRRIEAETRKGNWDLRRRIGNGDPAEDSKHVGDMRWFNDIHPNHRGTEVLAALLFEALTRPSR